MDKEKNEILAGIPEIKEQNSQNDLQDPSSFNLECQTNAREAATFKEIQKITLDDTFVLEHYSQNGEEVPKNIEISQKKCETLLKSQEKGMICDDSKELSMEIPKNKMKSSSFSKLKKFVYGKGENSGTMKKLLQGNKLKLNCHEYILYFIKKIFCIKKSFKEKIIFNAEEKFSKELDVINILSKLHELENLKMLLFDDDQLVLFNNISKPLIYVDDPNLIIESMQITKSEIDFSTWISIQRKNCLRGIFPGVI